MPPNARDPSFNPASPSNLRDEKGATGTLVLFRPPTRKGARPRPIRHRREYDGLTAGQKWIDAFFHQGARAVADYYADDFVFEDIILFQMINTKADLLRAFEPFDNYGPDSPLGVHQFDIIRYNGGTRSNQADQFRTGMPPGYDPAYWDQKTSEARVGAHLPSDEWAIMHWVWKVQHNADFLNMPAKGKTTHTRGVTHHLYNNGKIVQEYSYWNYRDVAIQLGVLPAPKSRHELSRDPGH